MDSVRLRALPHPRARRPLGARWLHSVSPLLYLAPALGFILVFAFYPLVRSVRNSFYNGNLLNPQRRWVGLEHYTEMLADPWFWSVLVNSVYYLGWALVGGFLLPSALALLALHLSEREIDLFQSTLFLPTVVATNIAVLIWIWFFLPAGGLFNTLLIQAGLPPGDWLKNTQHALTAVSLVANWKILGFHFLVALAGLRAIPRPLLEAARVDGARGWGLVRHILLPLFAPTALFLFVITLIQGLDYVFVPIEVMTKGGPAGATNNLMYAIYQEGFKYFRTGVASALSAILIALFGGLIYWQYRLFDRTVSYDR